MKYTNMTEDDETWGYFALKNANELVKKYGVQFFVDNLDRENVIAFCEYFRRIQDENNKRNRDN
jgi:hypothetical protein